MTVAALAQGPATSICKSIEEIANFPAVVAPAVVAQARAPFTPFGLVAFGGSAGCLKPLTEVLAALPADFPIPVVLVQHLGPRGVGVVLSGMMHDGAAGIAAVRRSGGATLAQDPRTAAHPGMPRAAVELGRADLTMSVPEIVGALQILAESGVR